MDTCRRPKSPQLQTEFFEFMKTVDQTQRQLDLLKSSACTLTTADRYRAARELKDLVQMKLLRTCARYEATEGSPNEVEREGEKTRALSRKKMANGSGSSKMRTWAAATNDRLQSTLQNACDFMDVLECKWPLVLNGDNRLVITDIAEDKNLDETKTQSRENRMDLNVQQRLIPDCDQAKCTSAEYEGKGSSQLTDPMTKMYNLEEQCLQPASYPLSSQHTSRFTNADKSEFDLEPPRSTLLIGSPYRKYQDEENEEENESSHAPDQRSRKQPPVAGRMRNPVKRRGEELDADEASVTEIQGRTASVIRRLESIVGRSSNSPATEVSEFCPKEGLSPSPRSGNRFSSSRRSPRLREHSARISEVITTRRQGADNDQSEGSLEESEGAGSKVRIPTPSKDDSPCCVVSFKFSATFNEHMDDAKKAGQKVGRGMDHECEREPGQSI